MTLIVRFVTSLFFVLLVLQSQSGWACTSSTAEEVSPLPLDDSATPADALLSLGDSPSLDPPLPVMGYAAFYPHEATPFLLLGAPLDPVLISISHHWSYWPQAPPTLV